MIYKCTGIISIYEISLDQPIEGIIHARQKAVDEARDRAQAAKAGRCFWKISNKIYDFLFYTYIIQINCLNHFADIWDWRLETYFWIFLAFSLEPSAISSEAAADP